MCHRVRPQGSIPPFSAVLQATLGGAFNTRETRHSQTPFHPVTLHIIYSYYLDDQFFLAMERMREIRRHVRNIGPIKLSAHRKGILPNPKRTGLSDNFVGATAYLTPIPAFFFLAIHRYNKRPYVRFHSWQSFVLSAFTYILGVILNFLLEIAAKFGPRVVLVLVGLTGLAALAIFLLWLWCVVNALNGKRYKLPIIGDWADEQAYR